MHLPLLIGDLTLILMVAGVFTVLFRRLNQPSVLGYLLAGLLVGPNVSIWPTVLDMENIRVWAELGVIFLLFLLGMEFSFKKLLKVGKPATISATVEVMGMLLIGFFVGKLFGWETVDAIFLGAVLSVSSTTIILKAFEELSAKTQMFASIVLGILVIEDLFAILILALLSTISATRGVEGKVFLIQSAKLVIFLLAVIPLGLKFVPIFLRKLRPHMNDESRVVLALGLCLSLVLLASKAGLSAALGAFLMGAFMAETVEGERIERSLKPIKDLFGAIFFTSVGMMVNLNDIAQHWQMVAIITVVTVVGKLITSSGGMLLAGQERKVAIQTGLSLAQIGEFSFIIATLGLDMGVVRSDLYGLAVAVSVVTTFLTPYLIRYAIAFRSESKRPEPGKNIPKLWDGHLVELEVHPHFVNLGRTLEELRLRESFGISVVAIVRGEMRITAPTRYDRLMGYDRVVVLGTDEQLKAFEHYLKSERHSLHSGEDAIYELRHIDVVENSPLIGRNLRNSGIRETLDGIVFGIERNGKKYLNPDSTFVLKSGDILWVYGEKRKIRSFESRSLAMHEDSR